MTAVRLDEPTTAATDWLLAAFAAYWAVSLMGAAAGRGADGLPTMIWGALFAMTALAALLGGAVHGFATGMGPGRTARLWRWTLHLVTLGSAGMLAAVLLTFPATLLRTVGLALVAAKLVAATVFVVRDPVFRVALIDHGMALVAVLALQAGAWAAHGAPSAPWIAGGVAVSVVASTIQAAGIAPHPRFNHNDLYHVLQIVALWLFYRGGLLLSLA